jgi:photoactive yellow protein
MTREQLDALPYGAIRLSPRGTIITYNATEGRLAGRSPQRVLGKNFFRDVAPCADVREFRGRFAELVATGRSMFYEFDFEFTFDPPARVRVTLLRGSGDDGVWVLVEPQAAGPGSAHTPGEAA